MSTTEQASGRVPRPPLEPLRPGGPRRAWALQLYRSWVGKKYVMAVTGMVLMLYILLHMIGNLKLYFGPGPLNTYGEFLRTFALTVAAFIAIYVIADFFDRFDGFLKHDATLGAIALVFLFKVPLIVTQITPLGVP